MEDIITLGRYSYHRPNIQVHTFGSTDARIIVGNFTSISSNCNILLSLGHHRPDTGINFSTYHLKNLGIFNNVLYADKPYKSGNVIIGNDVWIGHNVTIMPGVNIGDGSIIATNSHVIKDIEPYSIYGGNPARLIKYRFDKQIIDEFLKIKWWYLSDETIDSILPLLQQEPTLQLLEEMKNKISCQNL